jgi:lipopolysaccharide/colanic/teichoic acid biosynthesis glycosyltransferase
MKRALDFTFAGLALVLAAPLFVVCAVAIKVESRGPIFYRAIRVGRRGSELRVLKFRKMRDGAGGQPLTSDRDKRFTRIGRFLARTRLDELPQLWNVLTGGMSLVGPRPEDRGFVDLHENEYRTILTVRPGITGLSQLAFAKEAEILDPRDRVGHYVDRILPQKAALDTLYARSRSVSLDLRIMLWTVLPVLFRRDVAVHRATAKMSYRRRKQIEQTSAPAGPDSRSRFEFDSPI